MKSGGAAMRVKIISVRGTWRDVANCARVTVGMGDGAGEPSSRWKINMLLAEHSPIREITITAEWTDIPYYVAMHLVRHHQGCQPYVMSQRDDRQREPGQVHVSRKEKPQDAPVTLRFTFNQQAIINISRKRLCKKAAEETRRAWVMFLNRLHNEGHVELAWSCVPECVYRGFCPEMDSCGYYLGDKYYVELMLYHDLLEVDDD